MGEARVRRAKGLPPQGKIHSEPQRRTGKKPIKVRAVVPMDVLVMADGSVYDQAATGLRRITDRRVIEAAHAAIREGQERMRQLAVEEAKKREAAEAGARGRYMTTQEARAEFESNPAEVMFYSEEVLHPAEALPGRSPRYGIIWVTWKGGDVGAVVDELEAEARAYEWPWPIEWIGHDEPRSLWYIRRLAPAVEEQGA